MVKSAKPAPEGGGQEAGGAFSETVKDSAQQIWLAGLGAFSKAQQEGGKVFEALVKEGMGMQRKTQAAAGEKLSEASSRVQSMASEFSAKASGQWDKLEGIFEQRVSAALKRLGVPAASDIEALRNEVAALRQSVARLTAAAGRPAGRSAARGTAKPAAARKRVAPRKTT